MLIGLPMFVRLRKSNDPSAMTVAEPSGRPVVALRAVTVLPGTPTPMTLKSPVFHVALVMLTVSTSQVDVLEAVRLGAVGYLTKDLDADALLRSIRGARDGDLAMPRRIAARTIQDLVAGVGMRGVEHGAPGLDSLSPREEEILRLLAEGMTDREIGEGLTISTRTVESHVSNILRKLDARNRAAAARLYLEGR